MACLAAGLNTLLVFSYVMIMALYAMAFANYAQHFFPEATRAAWQPALASGVIVVLALVNLVGPRLVERSEGVLNLGKLLILAVFIVVGLGSSGLALERLGPADWVPVPQIVAGGMLVFLSYEGFELIANASDRIRQPERTLPWAYYGSVGVAIVLYVLLVAVTVGHLPFAEIARTQSYALAAAAELFMGKFGFNLLALGAVLAAASAINADLFGASKLPVILAQEGQVPSRYAREVWHRYPAALALVAVWAVVITRLADLRAISAASSAGFLLVFAMVNLANAKLARQTGSRRWIGIFGACACLAALAAMLAQMARQPGGDNELWLIGAVAALPFAYQLVFRRLAGAGRRTIRRQHRPQPASPGTARHRRARGRGRLLPAAGLPHPALGMVGGGARPPSSARGSAQGHAQRGWHPGWPGQCGLVGSKAELIGAMLKAGWHPADPITLRSSLEIAASVVLDRPDLDAPVSPLYLFGRKQDLAFEQEVGRSADRRHHVRWWLTDQTETGRPFWIGDASFDIDSGVSHLTGQITHHIAPDVDAMRDQLMSDLEPRARWRADSSSRASARPRTAATPVGTATLRMG